jgi:hypothetical protein
LHRLEDFITSHLLTKYLRNQPSDRPTERANNQPTDQKSTQPFKQGRKKESKQQINQSIKQPTNQPIKLLKNQELTNQLTSHSNDPPPIQPINQPRNEKKKISQASN